MKSFDFTKQDQPIDYKTYKLFAHKMQIIWQMLKLKVDHNAKQNYEQIAEQVRVLFTVRQKVADPKLLVRLLLYIITPQLDSSIT